MSFMATKKSIESLSQLLSLRAGESAMIHYDYLTAVMHRLWALVLATAFLTGLFRASSEETKLDHSTDKTNYPYVFVHGFFGWGQYDKGSDKLTYWGMFSGDLVKKVDNSGFTAVAARLSNRAEPTSTLYAMNGIPSCNLDDFCSITTGFTVFHDDD